MRDLPHLDEDLPQPPTGLHEHLAARGVLLTGDFALPVQEVTHPIVGQVRRREHRPPLVVVHALLRLGPTEHDASRETLTMKSGEYAGSILDGKVDSSRYIWGVTRESLLI